MTELRRITAVDLLAQVNNGLGGASTIDLDHLKAVLAALFVGNGYALFDALALKADADSVAASLATKADQDGVTAALALKADLDAMIAALAAKADQTGVDSALALKADADTVTTALAGKANAANAALTGVPVAPTAALGTNTQQLATTAFVAAALAALADSVPETLDTLAELAQALGDDPNFATTVTNLIATKLDASSASTFGRSLIDDADAAAARTTLGLDALLAAKAPTASPTFTGGITTGVNRLLAEATDLDTLVTAGFYRGLNLVNAPVTGWVYVTVDGHDASYAFQTVKRLFDAAGNSRQWMRMMHNGVWQDWTEVVTEQNYTSVILDATTSLCRAHVRIRQAVA
ncbi:pyocin knob domain-containing protein [uncultured Cohaesibacter sp.]|uniref:pyocin knob domain-containing protein n=1 Tax=uncultured Cohaesibacter sp. TaxID=1002546 RepID=UPI0029C75AB8|nr:pyocin knob domain-containing protein [uncultured Cohaesibacter sp.]